MAKTIKYVGLDVHKNSISIAIADQGRDSEVRFYGPPNIAIAEMLNGKSEQSRENLTIQE